MVYSISTQLSYKIFDLERIDYISAYGFQRDIILKVRDNILDLAVILCEHEPVITIGRASRDLGDLLVDKKEVERKNIMLYFVDRGGRTTYHGPGQLVIYIVTKLDFFNKDLHNFLGWLQLLGSRFLEEFGLSGYTPEGMRGIWVKGKKLISIGIAVKEWIAYHGMSINIQNKVLDNFKLIRPCGMDIHMGTLEEFLRKGISMLEAKRVFLNCFKKEIAYV